MKRAHAEQPKTSVLKRCAKSMAENNGHEMSNFSTDDWVRYLAHCYTCRYSIMVRVDKYLIQGPPLFNLCKGRQR